jgi:2-polyprenyl-3-methyl-5-hydroxy-6-metoxy-1,4-benzoquinol methylase
MSITSYFYEENAGALAEQYNSLAATKVHHAWRKYWPGAGDKVLDIGAASGRDSLWLTSIGCHVVACEPCKNLREIGEAYTGKEVVWVDDKLPELDHLAKFKQQFDVILLSAVWMHVPSKMRRRALQVLTHLLKRDGVIVVSLRHGPFNDSRESFPVSVSELKELIRDFNLIVVNVIEGEDIQHRQGVTWQTVVIKNNPNVGKEVSYGT